MKSSILTPRFLFLKVVLVIFLAACTTPEPAPQPTIPPIESLAPTLLATLPTASPTFFSTETPFTPTATIIEPTITPLPTEVELPDTPGIILFIGDGMGTNHRMAAAWKSVGEGGTLMMDSLPVHGLASTDPFAPGEITDSGAAGTAMAAGVQTYNGYVAMDPNGQPVTTILEYAQNFGWAVGLVSTVPLSHATPAVFASHDIDRNNMDSIAIQMMEHLPNVLLGGGEKYFSSWQSSSCYGGIGRQNTEFDLIANAISTGYTYTCSPEEFASLDLSNVNYLFGLFGAEEMLSPYQPTLAELTAAALEVLSHDPDGFFLMVEAGQIDWAGHENIAEDSIAFTLGLDAAVGQGLVFTTERPNTMLIVTADHETGGMHLNKDGDGTYLQDGPFTMPDGTQFWVDWSHGHHTIAPVPVTAWGPYTDLLAGEYHLTRIFDTMFLMLYSESQPE